MNITFLIGNGFDLNLGMKTKYSQFLSYYISNPINENEQIKRFKDDILKDFDEWSSAESAFGKYTEKFNYGEGDLFAECHEDFCEELAIYLMNQERKLYLDENNIGRIFYSDISNFYKGFRENQANQIKNHIDRVGSGYYYNFITFNYTTVLDKIINFAKKNDLGKRVYNNISYSNTIQSLKHVHGYTDKDMVLGVNDEEQLAKIEIFDNLPEEYLSQIIKIKTNIMLERNNDAKTFDVLKNSDLIYIYGMSIGETDKLWWTRIYDIMENKKDMRVIVHDFNAPGDQLIQTKVLLYEFKRKKEFLRFCEFDEKTKKDLFNRIHIDRTNIFENLNQFAETVKEENLDSA